MLYTLTISILAIRMYTCGQISFLAHNNYVVSFYSYYCYMYCRYSTKTSTCVHMLDGRRCSISMCLYYVCMVYVYMYMYVLCMYGVCIYVYVCMYVCMSVCICMIKLINMVYTLSYRKRLPHTSKY